jgi:hypothetical protein
LEFVLSEQQISQAEASSVTPATVFPGHGYPADRIETSPEPTGWIVSRETITEVKVK